MVKVCIDCTGNNKEWVASRSNPVHTDWCSCCGHRREVICYQPQIALEEQNKADNSASPKLPSLEECTNHLSSVADEGITGEELWSAQVVYEFIARQLSGE